MLVPSDHGGIGARALAVGLGVALAVAVSMPVRADAGNIAQTWSVGVEPFGVTVDPRDGKIFVANSDSANAANPGVLSIVDPAVAVPAGSIALASPPVMSALDVALDRLYVTLSNGTLAVVDVAARSVVATAPAGGPGLTLDAAAHRVYATTLNGLVLIDGTTGGVLARANAPAGDSWWAVAQDPVSHRVYVTNLNFAAPSVVVLDDTTLAIVATVALPAVPRLALTADPGRGLVYVGGYSSWTDPFGRVYAIDEASLQIVKTLDVGLGVASPFTMSLSRSGDALYVSDLNGGGSAGNAIVVVDASTFAVAKRLDLPFQPGQSATHPDGRLYVAGYNAQLLAAVLTFANGAPIVDSVRVTPDVPRTNDFVTALVSAHDPDGDPITLAYRWYRNGALLSGETAPALDLGKPGNGDRGDQISVLVNGSDGSLQSADTVTSGWAFFVGDTAPSVTASLGPTSPGTNDVLTATAAGTDVDGDALTYTFTWKVNGATRRSATGVSTTDAFDLALSGNGDRGDVVTVEVVASDGQLASAAASARATVMNSEPTATVGLSDPTPSKRDVLVASVTAADADNDALFFSYTWRVNGRVKQQTTAATTSTTSSFDLRAAEAEVGDPVTVEVVVTDGLAQALATASATITPAGR